MPPLGSHSFNCVMDFMLSWTVMLLHRDCLLSLPWTAHQRKQSCALFSGSFPTLCWYLWFRLVSLDWIKSVVKQWQEKELGLFGLGTYLLALPDTVLQWLRIKLYIHMYTWGKEKSARRIDDCHQLRQYFDRDLSPLYIFSPTLHTVAVKSWVGSVGRKAKAWFSSPLVSFAHDV